MFCDWYCFLIFKFRKGLRVELRNTIVYSPNFFFLTAAVSSLYLVFTFWFSSFWRFFLDYVKGITIVKTLKY